MSQNKDREIFKDTTKGSTALPLGSRYPAVELLEPSGSDSGMGQP